MSDFNSSLPVRTQANGDVAVFVSDGTTPSQTLAVDAAGKVTAKLNDGAGNSVTSQANGGQQALDVGIDVGGVQIDPRQIRALTSSDVVTANQGAASSNAAGWWVKPGDGTNAQSYTAAGEAKVDITQPLPAGTNSIGTVKAQLQDNAGTAITLGQKVMASSVPVVIASDQSAIGVYLSDPGTHIQDYADQTALAAGASANHDYTVPVGKTFHFQQVILSASGKAKWEIQQSQDGLSFSTVAVQFNSTAAPNAEFTLQSDVSVPAGGKVRIINTNKDNQAQDVYSTIVGYYTP